MTDHEQKPAIDRAVEFALYAPLGFALLARDMLPPLIGQCIERGKTEIEHLQQRVDNQLGQARIMGQFAVAQGRQQIKTEVDRRVGDLRQRGEPPTGATPPPEGAPEPPSRIEVAVDPQVLAKGNGRHEAAALPIPDYDELSASQVVARLTGLSRDELDAVQRYEAKQRQRKTILTKIEQLIA